MQAHGSYLFVASCISFASVVTSYYFFNRCQKICDLIYGHGHVHHAHRLDAAGVVLCAPGGGVPAGRQAAAEQVPMKQVLQVLFTDRYSQAPSPLLLQLPRDCS